MSELWDPQIADDPEQFVLFAYPWGKEGTPLHKHHGPRTWQRDELQRITAHIKDNKARMAMDLMPKVYQSATASGRGVGKSAFVSWMTDWMMTCHVGSSTIVTANTEPQLKTKTWGEVGKWNTLNIAGHWFEKQALSLKPVEWFKQGVESQAKIDCGLYAANALTWSEENPDAFAGAHNFNGMLAIFDEASGIHEKIWTIIEGVYTEPILHRYFLVFSNPRRNTGAFYECFHEFSEYWHRRQIDSRTVEGVDVEKLQEIVDKYGEDSREAKIEVMGQFPDQGDRQFISREVVDGAALRELLPDRDAPLIMGVDPARFGDDKAVIRFRQGRDARIIPPLQFKGLDNMQLANQCADCIERYNPDVVCIDAGSGTGVIDRLRELGYTVVEVWFGEKSNDAQWGNKRTELWDLMREWLKGGAIDNSKDLKMDLVGPEYRFMMKSDKIILEPKEEMKKRGLHSPDDADALALTFAVKPARRDMRTHRGSRRNRIAKDVDYQILG